jgi:hypothetical protein
MADLESVPKIERGKATKNLSSGKRKPDRTDPTPSSKTRANQTLHTRESEQKMRCAFRSSTDVWNRGGNRFRCCDENSGAQRRQAYNQPEVASQIQSKQSLTEAIALCLPPDKRTEQNRVEKRTERKTQHKPPTAAAHSSNTQGNQQNSG